MLFPHTHSSIHTAVLHSYQREDMPAREQNIFQATTQEAAIRSQLNVKDKLMPGWFSKLEQIKTQCALMIYEDFMLAEQVFMHVFKNKC